MPVRINITESDLTQAATSLSATDIVFVPGLSSIDSSDVTGAPETNQPTLCTSLSDFYTKFGSVPALFGSAQVYPVQDTEEGTVGFSADAIPGTGAAVAWFAANDPDPSFIYAATLLSMGIQVVYCRLNAKSTITSGTYTGTVAQIYSAMSNIFAQNGDLYSRGDYQFKYVTSGGYPVYEYNDCAIANNMTALASYRGDCVALIDHTDNPARALSGSTSVFMSLQSLTNAAMVSDYAAMYTPWAQYTQGVYTAGASTIFLPGSFAYLTSLATALQSSANWLVIAGITRGLVPNLNYLHTNAVLTNAIADMYQNYSASTAQSVCINAITNIKPYGLCIWGNRTLKRNSSSLKALSFVNLRCLVCDIKKTVYDACVSLMYEQNTSILWTNFKGAITPLLDQMVSGSGISAYKIVRNTIDSSIKISASIRVYPVYAVESFDISVQITDSDITVS